VIIADTHAWIWWLSGRQRLSPAALDALEQTDVGVSAITLWEVAMLAVRGRIVLKTVPLDWLRESLSKSRTVVIPITPEIAVLAANMARESKILPIV